MPSKKQEKESNPILKTEADLDRQINDLMNKTDSLMMDQEIGDVVSVIFTRGVFDVEGGKKKIKTVMGLRKGERNGADLSQVLLLIANFSLAKLGFKKDAIEKFIADQIKLSARPEDAKAVDEALTRLLNPLNPN